MKYKIYSTIFQRFIGLMFSKKFKNKALILKFPYEQNIRLHTFFVFFPITTLWINKNNIITHVENLKPFTISNNKKALYIVEMSLTKKYKRGMKFKI